MVCRTNRVRVACYSTPALWNTSPKPYIWTRTADQILESLTA